MTRVGLLAVALLVSAGPARFGAAASHPIAGDKLTLARTATGQKLTFVSKDPSFLSPAPGSPDDPSVGPGIFSVVLVSPNEGLHVLTVPVAGGVPGWRVRTGAQPVFRYKNRLAPGGASPVRMAVIKAGAQLEIVARSTGMPMAVPQGAVAVIVNSGGLTNCALFGPETVSLDVPGAFRARKAPAPAVADCFVQSLFPAPSCGTSPFPTCGGACPAGGACVPGIYTGDCHCVSASQPCGDTTPACNGSCPAGEECASIGSAYPLNTCGCIPSGATPCGSPGLPVCGGVCPAGTLCGAVMPFDLYPTCACVSPDPCGGSVPGRCAAGQLCVELSGSSRVCAPVLCSGTYPDCGGACGDGGVCRPANLDANGSGFPACVCSLPGPCEASCGGGNDCGAGEACHRGAGGCGCGAP